LLVYKDGWTSEINKTVKVLKVEKNKKAELREKIRIRVENLEALNEKARAENKNIILYLNGLPIRGVTISQPESDILEFALRRSRESKEVWTALITERDAFFSSKMSLSVGLEDGVPVPTDITDFTLIFIKRGWFIACTIAITFFLALFLWLARESNIIRDAGPEPGGDKKRPYSISRAQMAIWFFLVIASYPFLWLITGELGTITGSVLVLMGISASTALGASIIDLSKRSAAGPPVDPTRTSINFFIDVLSDTSGISFYRFQIFSWTIVLGIIFIAEVYSNLRMPEFSDTLLALMGVSSGTYIGFKFPEEQKS